jgi:hypothetical protein
MIVNVGNLPKIRAINTKQWLIQIHHTHFLKRTLPAEGKDGLTEKPLY